MITSTSLKHPTMRAKIIKATSNVIHKGFSVDHVGNANGKSIFAIRLIAGSIQVVDRHGRNITQQVAESF